jgi:hypothetical protein
MNTIRQKRTGLACALIVAFATVAAGAYADDTTTPVDPSATSSTDADSSSSSDATVAPQTAAQLDALVAPIALYPDSLVAQILAATQFPDQVAFADYWVGANKTMSKDDFAAAVDKETWDASVKALTQFPDVLHDLATNLSWSSSLGEAFHFQQPDVMAAVQAMRAKAEAAGNLKTTSQIKVVQQDPQTIVIQPASPDVVYVPQYNPTVVYGAPYVVPYYTPVYPYPAATAAISFGAGIAVGAAIGGGFGWGFHSWGLGWGGGGGWGHTTIIYNHTTYNHTTINNNTWNNHNTWNRNTTWNGNRNNYNGYHPWGPHPGPNGPHNYTPNGGRNGDHGLIGGNGGVDHGPNGGRNGDHGLIGGNGGVQNRFLPGTHPATPAASTATRPVSPAENRLGGATENRPGATENRLGGATENRPGATENRPAASADHNLLGGAQRSAAQGRRTAWNGDGASSRAESMRGRQSMHAARPAQMHAAHAPRTPHPSAPRGGGRRR